jgi:tetratricopeptide (TPR) repeat protein
MYAGIPPPQDPCPWQGEELAAYEKLKRMAGKEAVDKLLALNQGKLPSSILKTVQFKDKNDEKRVEKEPTAEECRVLGNELYKKGEYEGALGHYDKGIRLKDSVLLREYCVCMCVYVCVGNELYKKGEYEGALGHYDKGIRLKDSVLLREYCVCVCVCMCMYVCMCVCVLGVSR